MPSDDQKRRVILDRADRMLRQSKTLRKLSDELLQESKDLRQAAKKETRQQASRRRSRSRD
jgi:hypothetical protein